MLSLGVSCARCVTSDELTRGWDRRCWSDWFGCEWGAVVHGLLPPFWRRSSPLMMNTPVDTEPLSQNSTQRYRQTLSCETQTRLHKPTPPYSQPSVQYSRPKHIKSPLLRKISTKTPQLLRSIQAAVASTRMLNLSHPLELPVKLPPPHLCQ